MKQKPTHRSKENNLKKEDSNSNSMSWWLSIWRNQVKKTLLVLNVNKLLKKEGSWDATNHLAPRCRRIFFPNSVVDVDTQIFKEPEFEKNNSLDVIAKQKIKTNQKMPTIALLSIEKMPRVR